MLYIINALPGPALAGREGRFRPASDSEARAILAGGGWESAVGHEATAQALSAWAGLDVPFARRTLVLQPGDVLLVAALQGGRLEEGRVLSRAEVEARGWAWLLVEVEG